MLTERTWKEVSSRILADDVGKDDYVLPVDVLEMSQDGKLLTNYPLSNMKRNLGSSELGVVPNAHALGQLATRLGIPVRYARKMFEECPELLASNVNHWLSNLSKVDDSKDKETSWLLRTKHDTLRGVLSDKYTRLDNSFVFEALSNCLQDGAFVQVKNFDLNSNYLNFRIVFPDLRVDLGTALKKDEVMVGIHVTNSEVGASALRIDSCIFRQVCSNGLISRVGGDSLMNQRHVHLTVSEMENRVADAIGKAMRQGDDLIDKFARVKEVRVNDPIKVLEELSKKQKYSDKFTDTLKNSFDSEPGNTAYNVINAFTHASQTLPFENRLEVETYAGKLMDDFLKGRIS